MKYIINNAKCINDKKLQQKAKQLINRQTSRLSRLINNYRKPVTINIFFNRIDKITYQVSAVVVLREHLIYLKEHDTDIEAGIYKLFDKLKLSMTKKMHKEKKDYLYRRKRTRLTNLRNNLQHLKELRQESTKDTFKKVSKILLHDIAQYINRRVRATEITTGLKSGAINIQEILNDLYLVLYDSIEKIPGNTEDLNIWLHQKADELLDKKLEEFKFNKENLVRLDKILNKELKKFDEAYTVDADEEIIPMEELDEFTPNPNEYSIYERLFNEDEDTFIEEITLKLHQDKIQKIIHWELTKLPPQERSVMDLFLIEQLNEKDIAAIKKISVEEVRSIIEKKSKLLKDSLLKA